LDGRPKGTPDEFGKRKKVRYNPKGGKGKDDREWGGGRAGFDRTNKKLKATIQIGGGVKKNRQEPEQNEKYQH